MRAKSSLPVPVSPSSSTVRLLGATLPIVLRISVITALLPMMPSMIKSDFQENDCLLWVFGRGSSLLRYWRLAKSIKALRSRSRFWKKMSRSRGTEHGNFEHL